MSSYASERALDRVAWLASQGLDAVSFWRGATEPLARAVPHDFYPCWWTLDPASLLLTSHFNPGFPEVPSEWLEIYCDEEANAFAKVACSQRPAATLHDATGGEPSRSRWYRVAMEPYGAEQELRAVLRTKDGVPWAAVSLYRQPGRRQFDADELALLLELAPYLAQGTRRGLLIGEASDPEGPDAPGLLVLAADLSPESMTPGVERWLAELPDGDWKDKQRLPSAVLAVAGRALRSASGVDAPGEIALARVLSQTGRWIVLHGAALVSDRAPRAAVIIEPAHPARIAPLLMAAYALTEREQEVTQLVYRAPPPNRSHSSSVSLPTPCKTTSRTCSRRPTCVAAENSSATCSSPTTSRACATTSAAPSTASRYAEAPFPPTRPTSATALSSPAAPPRTEAPPAVPRSLASRPAQPGARQERIRLS